MSVTMKPPKRSMSDLAAAESLSLMRRTENRSARLNFQRSSRSVSAREERQPNFRQCAELASCRGDRSRQKRSNREWKTDLAFGNFPMALDETNHRLFVGCRLPSKLVVLNTDSGDVVAKIDISGDCDDLFYDAKRHRVYAICGAGKIDVIDQIDPNTYNASTKIGTADGARTGLFVPERDILFVAVPHRGSQQAEIRCYQIE